MNDTKTGMPSARTQALQTIASLPDTTDMSEFLYRLYVLDKIRKGQQAVRDGRTISAVDLKREIGQW